MFSNRFKVNIVKPEIFRLPKSILIINFIFQRLLRINGDFSVGVNYTSKINSSKNISFFKDKTTLVSFAVSNGCYFEAGNGISIGKHFLFAPGVKLISTNHDPKDPSRDVTSNKIVIGNNVWLGANVVVLPGVKIADNCIVGAGSIVTKNFLEQGCIIVGNPAKTVNNNAKI